MVVVEGNLYGVVSQVPKRMEIFSRDREQQSFLFFIKVSARPCLTISLHFVNWCLAAFGICVFVDVVFAVTNDD